MDAKEFDSIYHRLTILLGAEVPGVDVCFNDDADDDDEVITPQRRRVVHDHQLNLLSPWSPTTKHPPFTTPINSLSLEMVNFTCNSTLEDLRIGRSEVPIIDGLTFHGLSMVVGGGATFVAVIVSLSLIMMHATHYTRPYEQRHIIRILLMVPIYAIASWLSITFYWWEIYFSVMSQCYEAFAIASFFALLCHYIAPTLHEQKDYFRSVTPVEWVMPINWFANLKCLGGKSGMFRTPRSGLTWFNVIWFGVYQYCFIRVAMTITAVFTQYFGRYCASSDSPLFAHVWVLVIESMAVTIAMYFLIQFYVQLKGDLAEHKPLLKVIAIKLVIFLSFWQSVVLSILTSESLGPVLSPTKVLAYPDLMVGVPNLLLCLEMMLFAILHIFAFPYHPYRPTVVRIDPSGEEVGKNLGGFMGIAAIFDALNPWDLVKAFARGTRWFFVGRKSRMDDPSYKPHLADVPLDEPVDTAYKANREHLPIADEFRKSNFGMNYKIEEAETRSNQTSETIGLISNASPSPSSTSPLPPTFAGSAYTPARQRCDAKGYEIPEEDHLKTLRPGPRAQPYINQTEVHSYAGEIGTAYGGHENEQGWPQPQFPQQHPLGYRPQVQRHDSVDSEAAAGYDPAELQQMQPSHQQAAHAMLWGPNSGASKEQRL